MNGKEKILDQLKNNHQQCQNLVLARGWHIPQRSGEIELNYLSSDSRDGIFKLLKSLGIDTASLCSLCWNFRMPQPGNRVLVRGEGASLLPAPTFFYIWHLDRYLKTTWTVFLFWDICSLGGTGDDFLDLDMVLQVTRALQRLHLENGFCGPERNCRQKYFLPSFV